MSEVFSMSDLSIADQYKDQHIFERFGSHIASMDNYTNTITDLGHLELVKSKIEIMVETLYDEIDGKIHTLKLSKNFNLENMVKSLPVDVIELIKEFMRDDIEIVRKSFVLFNFNPWPYNIHHRVGFECERIRKKKLIKLLQNMSNNYIVKSKNKSFYCDMIANDLYHFYSHFLPNAPLSQTMKNISAYSINQKYLYIRLIHILR
jgi:hypothetical protein